MSSLAAAVYNKTDSTRTHITVLLGGGSGTTMQHIIRCGLELKIFGEGFVWIQLGASNVVEEMISSVTAMPKDVFRKTYAGFLSINGPIFLDKLRKTMLDTPRHFMTHRVLQQYGEQEYGVNWQDKALDPKYPGAGTNNLAYDAVWATAIGLAAARQKNDMKNVAKYSRSGGGRGPFTGASGVVTFGDDGERGQSGITYSLVSLIPGGEGGGGEPLGLLGRQPVPGRQPAYANWSTPVFSAGWTEVARHDGIANLVLDPSNPPYWPGGMRSWTAPLALFPSEELPSPTIVEKVVNQEKIVNQYEYLISQNLTPLNVVIVVVPTVMSVLVLVAVAYVVYRYSTKENDEVGFENLLRQLRCKLKLTQEDGFVLSNEIPSFFLRLLSSRKLVVISKRHMEAATRLWRLEEFDLAAFDALCVIVGDSEYHTTSSERGESLAAQEGPGDVESGPASCTHPFSRTFSLSGVSNHDNIGLIRAWLLDLALSVLKDIQTYRLVIDDSQSVIPIGHFNRENRSQSFVDAKTFSQRKNSYIFPNSFHGNRRALETYFREKIMAVHMWQANSCALFKDLKIPVADMMVLLNDDCYKRFKAIIDEPYGKELCNFRWNPERDEFSIEDVTEEWEVGNTDTDDVMRQDDEHVQAVRWNERDAVEQSYENISQHLKRVCKSGLRIDADESVFVTQLHRSARLLDRAFKRKVTEILSSTSDQVCTGDPLIMSSTPHLIISSTHSHDELINFNPMEAGDHGVASWLNQSVNRVFSQHYDVREEIENDGAHRSSSTTPSKTPSSHHVSDESSIIEPPESTGCVTIRVRMFKERPNHVTVFFAPIKTQERIKEKLLKYCFPHPWSRWPLVANIRDVIRLAIACDNPSQILQIVRLFLSTQASTGLKVVRVKNKFSQGDENVRQGLNGLDITLNVLFKEPASGLQIIGEIQVHDKRTHEVKSRIHKLYKIKRAHHPASIT